MARKQRKLEGEGTLTTKTSPEKELDTPVRKKSGGTLRSVSGTTTIKSHPKFPDLKTVEVDDDDDDDDEEEEVDVEIDDCECAAVCPSKLKEDMIYCKTARCEAKIKKSCSSLAPVCFSCCRLEHLQRRTEPKESKKQKAEIQSIPDEELDSFPEAYKNEGSFADLVNGASTLLNRNLSLENTTDDTISSRLSTTSMEVDDQINSTPEKLDFKSDSGSGRISNRSTLDDSDKGSEVRPQREVEQYRPDLEDYNSHIVLRDGYVRNTLFLSMIFGKDSIRNYTLYPINATHLAFARKPQFWLEVNPVGKPPRHLTLFHHLNGKFLQVYQYLLGDVRLYKNKFYVARTRLITLDNEQSPYVLVRPFLTTCANPASGAIVCDLNILEKDARMFKDAFSIIRFDNPGVY
jgi:hypothetical protein